MPVPERGVSSVRTEEIENHPVLIEQLWITQEAVRSPQAIPEMVKHIQEGGHFQEVCLFAFPDGRIFLHDGHHRALSLFLAGREILGPSEYHVEHLTYDNINKVFFDLNFVTPYDPRVEIRLENFGEFKEKALALFQEGRVREAVEFIARNKNSYAAPRTIRSIPELAWKWRTEWEGDNH